MQKVIGGSAGAMDWADKLNKLILKGWKIESMHIAPYGDYSINLIAIISRHDEESAHEA